MATPVTNDDGINPKESNVRPETDIGRENTAGESTPKTDELPEWEPLTPELVEDEAIRNDFVMRWAVVGLAVLLGCSQISETKSLIHIRTGEYIAAHGFLPPKTDVFAYTRADQPWVNLSWLFDLVAAGVHGLGGGLALSVFQALVAVGIFSLLVHTSRPGIRTWWGSICAALALLASFRQFTIQPEIITLLGVGVTMWLMVRTQEGSSSAGVWAFVPLIWVWSQLDSRAYLGWGLLLAYAVGGEIGALLGRSTMRDGSRRRQFWIVTIVAILAAGLHPFLWRVWTAPWLVYGEVYPAWRAAYFDQMTPSERLCVPFWDLRFWISLNFEGLAVLYLMVAALISMALNFRRTPISHVAMYLLINVAALPATQGLAAASLVNCVLATLNAQDWYFNRYGQAYSIQPSFLLFTRGGRAVTVLGMFAIAYLVISGRIDGPNGKRTGLGFDKSLQNMMDGYEAAVADSYDDRPFTFAIRQGDLMIWAKQRTFIDSRLELFHGPEESLLDLHYQTRVALRRKSPGLEGSGNRNHWRKIFDQYEITHVVPRFGGMTLEPNYSTFNDLVRSYDWALTKLSSAVAVFYRTDLRQDRALRTYIAAHRFDPTELAFSEDAMPVKEPQVWPLATTAYQQALSLPSQTMGGPVAEAGHYLNYALQDSMKPLQRLAAVELAVRHARAGLRADPNSDTGYRTLGAAYSVLDQLETFELRRLGVQLPHLLRYFQVAAAHQSSLLLEPNDALLHHELGLFYLRLGKSDVALHHLQRQLELQPLLARDSLNEEAAKQVEQFYERIQKLDERMQSLQSEVDSRLAKGTPRPNVALFSYQYGGVLMAIRVLEEDQVGLVQSPQSQVMLAGWLIEVGRVEDADRMLRQVALHGPGVELLPGFVENSAYTAWFQGDYERTARIYEAAVAGNEQRRLASALTTGPLTATTSTPMPGERYPALHIAATSQIVLDRTAELGSYLLNLALCRLEQGDIPAAKAALQRGLETVPDNGYWPLYLLYWECLTGEQLEVEPPSDWIPIEPDMFAPEAG
jgi:tetratricopeptide (TPR) repeat protein